MLNKKDIEALNKINDNLSIKSTQKDINNAIAKFNHVVANTTPEFEKVAGHDLYGKDEFGSYIDNVSDTNIPDYRDPNNNMKSVDWLQISVRINIAIHDAKKLYYRHKLFLLVNSVNKTNTKNGRKNLLAFFVGNRAGILAEQKKANKHGTHNFMLYRQTGWSQANRDSDYIKAIKHGDFDSVPAPKNLLNNNNAIAKNIKLGQKVMKKQLIGA